MSMIPGGDNDPWADAEDRNGRENEMTNVVFMHRGCEKQVLEGMPDGCLYFRYPETGRLPREQVETCRRVAGDYAAGGKPFAVLTTSPYVVKALEVEMEKLELAHTLRFLNGDGQEIAFQDAFYPFSDAFARLMSGDSWTGEKDNEPGKESK